MCMNQTVCLGGQSHILLLSVLKFTFMHHEFLQVKYPTVIQNQQMQITGSPMAWAPKPTDTTVGSLCYKKKTNWNQTVN